MENGQKAHVVVQRKTDTWASTVGDPETMEIKHAPPGQGCPACGCLDLAMKRVRVKNELLIEGEGSAVYGACTKCDWQSEMIATTD